MKTFSLGEAAKASGKGKSTIRDAIKSGKLAADKVDGLYKIQVAELERVYGTLKSPDQLKGADSKKPNPSEPNGKDGNKLNELHILVEKLEYKLKIEETERTRERENAQAEIERMNKALSKAQDVALFLTDQRRLQDPSPEPIQANGQGKASDGTKSTPERQTGFFGRVFGRTG